MSGPAHQGPFSQLNRIRLIDEYFGDRSVDPVDAWKDVYRLLLWIDSRTGIAHCYESDKAQPGRPWYRRSLIFHRWVAEQLGVTSTQLKDEIDWMFRQVIRSVTEAEADEMVADAAGEQRSLFGDADMPLPGDDPQLQAILDPVLRVPGDPEGEIADVIRQVYVHMRAGNKRANLLGRGFEDVLAGVLGRIPAPPPAFETQALLDEIPGFRPTREGDKAEKVDLWVGDGEARRVMVSAKWSVRADREKQFTSDLETYVRANDWRAPFEYVWITNDFDPARLVANATNVTANRELFDAVVHVCPAAVWEVHKLDRPKGSNPTKLRELLESGRVVGLGEWLQDLPHSGRR